MSTPAMRTPRTPPSCSRCSHPAERERLILQLRFHEDLTQAEIGERLGISQMHVSRLIRKSITRLQAAAR